MKEGSKKLLAIHGLGGHSGWFDLLRDELEPRGIDLIAADLPGFGLNHKEHNSNTHYIKGHIECFQEWTDFVKVQYSKLKEEYGQVDILGHSLGAVLASAINFDYNDKLILSVPGYKGAADTFNPAFVGRALWHYVFDKMLLRNNVFLEMPISDKMQDTPAMRDELRVSELSQNLLFEVLKLGKAAKENLASIKNEVLMLQVEGDVVVDNATQDEYFHMIGSENKTKQIISGTDHDWIWTDANPKIAETISQWLINS